MKPMKRLKKILRETMAKIKYKLLNLQGYYGQYGEDRAIGALMPEISFYVDVGAYEPKLFSNTYRFYKKGGSGILIEPNPDKIRALKQVRPRDTVLNVGIGTQAGEMPYYVFDADALNTFSEQVKEKNIKDSYKLIKTIKIQVLTLAELLKEADKIDLLSIDTEGWDFEALSSLDWERHNPKVICIEDNKDSGKIQSLLRKKGYEKHFLNGTNSIWRREMK